MRQVRLAFFSCLTHSSKCATEHVANILRPRIMLRVIMSTFASSSKWSAAAQEPRAKARLFLE